MSLGNFTKPLATVWLIDSQLSVFALRDYLVKFIDNDDSLLVIVVDPKNWGGRGLPQISDMWLRTKVAH